MGLFQSFGRTNRQKIINLNLYIIFFYYSLFHQSIIASLYILLLQNLKVFFQNKDRQYKKIENIFSKCYSKNIITNNHIIAPKPTAIATIKYGRILNRFHLAVMASFGQLSPQQ